MHVCRLYDVACGCRLEGAAAEVAQWLRSPDLERGVAPYCKADLLRGLNKDLLLTEDVEVEGRCSEAFAAVKRFEESHKVAAQVGLAGVYMIALLTPCVSSCTLIFPPSSPNSSHPSHLLPAACVQSPSLSSCSSMGIEQSS